MKNNNFTAGLVLIALGIAFFMRNFDISVINTLLICGGLYFLYSYTVHKQQPHLLFGIILTASGAAMFLRDIGKLRFDIGGEMFLLILGLGFLFFYFNKGIKGFVFPGYILSALAIYSLIENNINDHYMWPSFFILLGLAFYFIFFTAYMHRSSWPLIPGTILILFGLTAFAFVLGIVTIDMLTALGQYQNYILSGAIIAVGIGLLYRGLKR